MTQQLRKFLKIPAYIFAFGLVLVIRLIRPWLLVRIGSLISNRIGHFAANTELYMCELDAGINVPKQSYIDLFYMAEAPICNRQLAIMWRRVLRIGPAWLLAPIRRINRLLPNSDLYDPLARTSDIDTLNLWDQFSPHIQFSDDEEKKGERGLQAMGIGSEDKFVCLIVRDSAYMSQQFGRHSDFGRHSFRDSDIHTYAPAAEALAQRGYFVIRMGEKVNASINSNHPKVIDYATNGMRNEFMDLYLGAKCYFCISTGTGLDAIPMIFNRPIAYINFMPIGYLRTFTSKFLAISKRFICATTGRPLTLQEILERVGFSLSTDLYTQAGIQLVDNTPEEIRDLVDEMESRLAGLWPTDPVDESLQKEFWKIFLRASVPMNVPTPVHSKVLGRVGTFFLRKNLELLM